MSARVTIMRLEQWDLWNLRGRGFSPACSWCRKVLIAGDLIVVTRGPKDFRIYYHSVCFDVAKQKGSL